MSTASLAFLGMVIFALTLFGVVLGYASWEETRASKRKSK